MPEEIGELIKKEHIQTMKKDIARFQVEVGEADVSVAIRTEPKRKVEEEAKRMEFERKKAEEGRKLEEEKRRQDESRRREEEARQRLEAEKRAQEAAIIQVRAAEEERRRKLEEEKKKREEEIRIEESRRIELEKKIAEEKQRAEEEQRRREQESKRIAELERQKIEEERKKQEEKRRIKEERRRKEAERPKTRKEILLLEKEKLAAAKIELDKSLRALSFKNKPFDSRKTDLLLRVKEIEKNFQLIDSNEKEIEEKQKIVEEKEGKAISSKEKMRFEKERWQIEEQRRELEQKRWPWEEKLKQIKDQINGIDLELQKAESEKGNLEARQKEILGKEEKIFLEIEKIGLQAEIQKLEQLKSSFEEGKTVLLISFNKAKENLDKSLIKENQIEQEEKMIEEEEKTAGGLKERRQLETERWQIEEKRREAETERWRLDEEKNNIEIQLKKLISRIQVISDGQKNINNKIKEIDIKLGLVAPDIAAKTEAAPKIEEEIKEAETKKPAALEKMEEIESEGQRRIEEARKRIAELKKEIEGGKEQPEKPEENEFVKQEERREELMKRFKPLEEREASAEFKPRPMDSTAKAQVWGGIKGQPIVRVLPKKPTFGEKLWVRLLIFTVALALLLANVTFWYWFFKVRKQLPANQPETGQENAEIPSIYSGLPDGSNVIAPLVSVETAKTLKIYKPEDATVLLKQALGEKLPESQFIGLVIKNEKENRIIGLKEFFSALSLKAADEFYAKTGNEITLFIYSQPEGNRLGLALRVADKKEFSDLLKNQEATMEEDYKAFFSLMGEQKPAAARYFRDANQATGYSGPNFRYKILSSNDLGIYYFVSDNYFVFASSWQSMEKAIKKLNP